MPHQTQTHTQVHIHTFHPPPPTYSSATANTVPTSQFSTQPTQSWFKTWIVFGAVILCWYTTSSLTNNSGKQLLREYQYPITLTMMQFGFIASFSYIFVYVQFKLGKPWALRPMNLKAFSGGILHIAVYNLVGHVFSSISLMFIPVSFVHTIKAISPLFTVILAKLVLGSKFSRQVYLSLVPLIAGVILACSSEISFNMIGFVCALLSSLIFVWQNIFSKKLFQEGQLDEYNILFFSSLVAFTLLIPVWLFYEGYTILTEDWPTSRVCFLFLFNGVAHFGQNIFAFTLLSQVTPVTYSIASLLKRIFIITTAIIWFSTPITITNALGMLLTFIGLFMYNRAKEVGRPHITTKKTIPFDGQLTSPSVDSLPRYSAIWQVLFPSCRQ